MVPVEQKGPEVSILVRGLPRPLRGVASLTLTCGLFGTTQRMQLQSVGSVHFSTASSFSASE